MVSTPNIDPNWVNSELQRLQTAINKLTGKNLQNAVIGSGGITVNGGSVVIQGSGGITLPAGGSIVDASGHVLLQADVLGGLSRPWAAVPMRPMFDDGPVATSANRTTNGFYGPIELLQGQIVTNQLVWAGTIPEMLYPKFSVYGWFGYTTNPNTINVTIQFNGVTVATISSGSLILPQTLPSVYGPYDVHGYLGQQAIQVSVFANSTQLQGPSDLLACDFEQVVLRGS